MDKEYLTKSDLINLLSAAQMRTTDTYVAVEKEFGAHMALSVAASKYLVDLLLDELTEK
jgi:hypothetical protein